MTLQQALALIDNLVANIRNPPLNRAETLGALEAMQVLANAIAPKQKKAVKEKTKEKAGKD